MTATLVVTMATDADTPDIDYNLSEATDAVSFLFRHLIVTFNSERLNFLLRGKCAGAALKIR